MVHRLVEVLGHQVVRQELDLVVDLDFYLEDLLVEVHPEVAIPVVVVLEVADPKEVHLVVVSDEHHENATLHVVSSEVEVLVTMQFEELEPNQVGLVLAEPVEVVPTMVDLAVVVDPTVAEVPVVVVLVVEVLAMADLVEVDLEEVDQVQVVPKAVVQEDLAVVVVRSASLLTHPAEVVAQVQLVLARVELLHLWVHLSLKQTLMQNHHQMN